MLSITKAYLCIVCIPSNNILSVLIKITNPKCFKCNHNLQFVKRKNSRAVLNFHGKIRIHPLCSVCMYKVEILQDGHQKNELSNNAFAI